MSQFSVLLLILITAFTRDCQAIQCQVYPAKYTFVLNPESFDTTRCTSQVIMSTYNDYMYSYTVTTCTHPSTLTDSNLGSETSGNQDYYVWGPYSLFPAVLFTFSQEINLTNITLYDLDGLNGENLHYILPTLNFYAVDDAYEFASDLSNSRNILTVNCGNLSSSDRIRRTMSFNVTQPTMSRQVLMERVSTRFLFALSEVQFFTSLTEDECEALTTTTSTSPESSSDTSTASTTPDISTSPDSSSKTSTASTTQAISTSSSSSLVVYVAAAVAVIVVIRVILILIAIFIFIKYRKSGKEKTYREQAPHPLTGQIESHRQETAYETPLNTQNNNHPEPINPMYEVVDRKENGNKTDNDGQNADQAVRVPDNSTDQIVLANATYAVLDEKKKKNRSNDQQSTSESHGPSQATYAVVDKSKKKKKEEEPLSDCDPPPIPQHTVDQLYTAVHKKKRTPPEDNDGDTPPIPPHTIDELYTAVQKKTDKDTDPPPIPPKTGEEP